MDDKGKGVNSNNHGDAGNSLSRRRRGAVLKPVHKQFLLTAIIAISLAFTFFTAVYLLAQNRQLAEANQGLSKDIKAQTDINQRYLRCILLIEREKFTNVELRVEAIDTCAIESRTPNGNATGSQPTSQQQQNFEQPKQPQPSGAAANPPQASPSSQTSSTTQPTAQTEAQPSAVESVISTVTKPVKELLNL